MLAEMYVVECEQRYLKDVVFREVNWLAPLQRDLQLANRKPAAVRQRSWVAFSRGALSGAAARLKALGRPTLPPTADAGRSPYA